MKATLGGFLGAFLFFALIAALPQDVYNTKYTQHIATLLFMKSDAKAQFRDTGLYINSSADTKLDIVSDGVVDISCDSVRVDSILNIDTYKIEVSAADSLLFITGTDTFVIRTKR